MNGEKDWLVVALVRIGDMHDKASNKKQCKALWAAFKMLSATIRERNAAELEDFRSRGDHEMRRPGPFPKS